MATIVQLSDYRSARTAEQREAPDPQAGMSPGPHYFCTRCETDRFRLFSSGSVHCAQCGALMRNINVADAGSGKTGAN